MNGNLLLLRTYFNHNNINRIEGWYLPARNIKLPGSTNLDLLLIKTDKNEEKGGGRRRSRIFRPQIQVPDVLFPAPGLIKAEF